MFGKTKKRSARRRDVTKKRVNKYGAKKSKRVYKMRGGWGEPMTPMVPLGVMKGGWGGAVILPNN